MLAALHTTAELLAIGLGLPSNALTSLMEQGPHLLGPTGDSGCLSSLPVGKQVMPCDKYLMPQKFFKRVLAQGVEAGVCCLQ